MFHLPIFRRQVKGGILLYVLVIAAIFSLLLQFYLNAQVATAKNLKAQEDYQTAQLMVTLAHEKLQEQSGSVTFSQGVVFISPDKTTVRLSNGTNYAF